MRPTIVTSTSAAPLAGNAQRGMRNAPNGSRQKEPPSLALRANLASRSFRAVSIAAGICGAAVSICQEAICRDTLCRSAASAWHSRHSRRCSAALAAVSPVSSPSRYAITSSCSSGCKLSCISGLPLNRIGHPWGRIYSADSDCLQLRARGQVLLQRHAGAEQARSHCVQWKVQQFGNVSIAQLVILAQHQDLPLCLVQFLQSFAHPERAFGRSLRHRFCNRVNIRAVMRVLTSLRQQQLERDCVQVRPHQRARFIALSPAYHHQEGLLRQVFGAQLAVEPPPEEAVERASVAYVQFVERLARTLPEREHQDFIADHGCRCISFGLPRTTRIIHTCNAANGRKVPQSPGKRRVSWKCKCPDGNRDQRLAAQPGRPALECSQEKHEILARDAWIRRTLLATGPSSDCSEAGAP